MVVIPYEYFEVNKTNKVLRETGLLSDCVFLVGKAPDIKTFRCHKVILTKASSVFETMFCHSHLHEQQTAEIRDENTEPQIFEILLRFIYTRNVTCTDIESTMKLASAAETYDIPFLKTVTKLDLLLAMNPSNAILLYELCQQYNSQATRNVKQKALNMIVEYTDEVLAADSFKRTKHSTLLMIVQLDHLNVKEVYLILACEKWAENEVESLQLPVNTAGLTAVLGDISYHLRYLVLQIPDLNMLQNCKLITNDQKSELRQRITSTQLPLAFPRYLVKHVAPTFVFSNKASNYNCYEICYNRSTLDGSGYNYTIDFIPYADIAFLGLKCIRFFIYPTTIVWSVTLDDEANKSYNLGHIYGRSMLKFQNTNILKAYHKYRIKLTVAQRYYPFEGPVAPACNITLQKQIVLVPNTHPSILQGIIYGEV